MKILKLIRVLMGEVYLQKKILKLVKLSLLKGHYYQRPKKIANKFLSVTVKLLRCLERCWGKVVKQK